MGVKAVADRASVLAYEGRLTAGERDWLHDRLREVAGGLDRLYSEGADQLAMDDESDDRIIYSDASPVYVTVCAAETVRAPAMYCGDLGPGEDVEPGAQVIIVRPPHLRAIKPESSPVVREKKWRHGLKAGLTSVPPRVKHASIVEETHSRAIELEASSLPRRQAGRNKEEISMFGDVSDEQRNLAREAARAHVADPVHDQENCEACRMHLDNEWLSAADDFKDALVSEVFRLKDELDYFPDWPIVLNSGYETVDAIRKVLGPWRNTDYDPEMMSERPDLVGRPDLAIQSWVLKPPYRELFTRQELAAAREGLQFRTDENRVAQIIRRGGHAQKI